MSKDIKIGLFGYGCVGQGLHDVLQGSKGFTAKINAICVKDKNKKRSLPAERFSYDKASVLENPEVNTVVELIDDANEALDIVRTALKSGKNAVSANKKMIAENLEELVQLQQEFGAKFLYEASSCASIPIIRNLEEYYDNDTLQSVSGIFNGSSNYILSKVFQEGWSYDEALKEAQDLGFAETDPTLDVGGFDAKYKLVILTYHSFGVWVKPSDILNIGIQNLKDGDVSFAKEKGLKVKQIATVTRVGENQFTLFVLPQLVDVGHYLYEVENEYNGVMVEAGFACTQTFIGKGAGGHPTGSAVLSDISALQHDYGYEYKKLNQKEKLSYTTEVEIPVYVSYSDESLIQELNITDVSERFESKTHKYVIGKVKVSDLIKKQEVILSSGAFVAYLGA